MITVTTIKAQDTFAYSDLNFTFQPGIHQIKGLNGSSKTSLFASLLQCLYQKNPKGTKVDEVSNAITGKPYHIEVEFLKDGKQYKVINSKKTGKVEVYENGRDISLKRIPDNLALIEDLLGCDYAMARDLIYQSPESSINLLETSSDGERKKFLNRILKFDLLDSYHERMKAREKELGGKGGTIQQLQKQLENLEAGLMELQEELQEVNTSQLSAKVTELETEKDRLKQLQSDLTVELKEIEAGLRVAEEQAGIEAELLKKEAELSLIDKPTVSEDDLQAALQHWQARVHMVAAEISRLKESKQRAEVFQLTRENLRVAQEKMGTISKPEETQEFCEEQLRKITGLLGKTQAEKDGYHRELAGLLQAAEQGVCPTCGHGVDQDQFTPQVAQLKQAISGKDDLVVKCETSISKYRGMLEQLSYYSRLQQEIDKLTAALSADTGDDPQEVSDDIDANKDWLQEAETELQQAQEQLKVSRRHTELVQQVSNLRVRINPVDATELSQKKQHYALKLSDVVTALTDTDTKLAEAKHSSQKAMEHNANAKARKELNRQIAENNEVVRGKVMETRSQLEAAHETLDLVKTWLGILGPIGYRVHAMEKFLHALNKSIRSYMELISNGRISCRFYIEEGEIAFTVTDAHKTIPYSGWSAGQKARVKLACLFAVLELLEATGSVSFSVLCFDEVFGALDYEGKEGLFRVLEMLRCRNKSIFIIAHSDLVLPLTYDSTITATMLEDGTTEIKQ